MAEALWCRREPGGIGRVAAMAKEPGIKQEGESMYGQLLAAVLADQLQQPDGAAADERDLVHELAHCRVRLAPSWGMAGDGLGGDAAASLAAQLHYDATLLRLCHARGIACSPERFSRPEAERQRLERALAEAGVPVS